MFGCSSKTRRYVVRSCSRTEKRLSMGINSEASSNRVFAYRQEATAAKALGRELAGVRFRNTKIGYSGSCEPSFTCIKITNEPKWIYANGRNGMNL